MLGGSPGLHKTDRQLANDRSHNSPIEQTHRKLPRTMHDIQRIFRIPFRFLLILVPAVEIDDLAVFVVDDEPGAEIRAGFEGADEF